MSLLYRKIFYLLILMLTILISGLASASGGFDYPVGWPNATGNYDAQDFGEFNSGFGGYHLGEDWNKSCGGDCDLGDPIYSIAEGKVVLVAARRTWGNVVVIEHEGRVNALYAHLRDIYIKNGQSVSRGEKIGTMGKGDRNMFAAHLHFEIRDNLSIGIGSGYGSYKPKGWLDPSEFINSNRPKPPVSASTLSGEVESQRANLSWSENPSENFDRYEIYRSETKDGTKNPEKRTTIAVIKNKSEITFKDPSELLAKKEYFYAVGVFEKDGRSAISNEIVLTRDHEIINLTNGWFQQDIPRIDGRYVVWRDFRREQNSFPQFKTLYYYDLLEKKIKTAQVGDIISPLQGPHNPDVYGDWVCYEAKEASNARNEIYCHSIKNGYDLPITDNSDNDFGPKISSAGYIVWTKMVGSHAKLYALNLGDARGEYLVVDAPLNQSLPNISGSIVVWKDTRIANRTDIYIKDLAGGEEILLATNTGREAAEISGDYVTWYNKGKLYLINIKTREQKVILSGDVRDVKIDGNRVAYFKYEEGLKDQEGNMLGNIYIYDISNGVHAKIENPLRYVPKMDIFENILVFSAPGPNENHELDTDIFLVYL